MRAAGRVVRPPDTVPPPGLVAVGSLDAGTDTDAGADPGSGVAAVAALLEDPSRFEPPVVAVLSGGNVDPVLLLRVIQHGMIAAGRYLSFRVRIGDRPGELARLLRLLAELGANVIDVEHSRTTSRLNLGEVVYVRTERDEHRVGFGSS